MTSKRIPPDAFDFYVGLGSERSYRLVAEQFGVSKRAVTKLAAREHWAERLVNIESEARERSDAKLVETVEEMRSRHLKMARAMGARVISALREYPLGSGMEAMRGAEMVIKLERLIVGEPSDRTAVTVEEVTKRELASWLTDEPDDVAGGCEQGHDDES